MKYLFIFMSLIALIELSSSNDSKNEDQIQLRTCPETTESDILRVHGFLTSSQLEVKRKAVNIEEFDFNSDDLERQHTDAFVNYWNKRDVKIVSSSNICLSINKSLMSEKEISNLLSEFSPIYFKVKNLYVILYRKKTGHIEKGNNPVQILDENFNIISNYRI